MVDAIEKQFGELKLEDTRLKSVDLFAGTGAFSLGFNKRFRPVFANDKEKSSQHIYGKNHDSKVFVLGDLNDIADEKIPEHDLLCGGFPCQPFSVAGQKQGFKDPRANVFWKIISILKLRSPRFAVLENVKNVKTHDDGKSYKTIIDALIDAGYHVNVWTMNTYLNTKVPQNRERTYFICCKNEKDNKAIRECKLPEVDKPNPILDYLETEQPIPARYYYSATNSRGGTLKAYAIIKDAVVKDVKTNTVYQFRRQYVRENKSGVCPTLTANMGSGGHNVPLILDGKGIRKLTPRECFNLQGFPKKYDLAGLSDCKLYKLAGNAVSVPVVEFIAGCIATALDTA